MTDRERVLRVMRTVADALRERGSGRPGPELVERAIATACDTLAIAPQVYREIVDSDPTLSELEQLAIGEALTEMADPGPYAAISRESNSGKPGDLTKARSHPQPSRR